VAPQLLLATLAEPEPPPQAVSAAVSSMASGPSSRSRRVAASTGRRRRLSQFIIVLLTQTFAIWPDCIHGSGKGAQFCSVSETLCMSPDRDMDIDAHRQCNALIRRGVDTHAHEVPH
jgi:hypothetical protein